MYGASLISRATRHAHVHVVSQFLNIVIEDWCWRVNGGVGTGAVVYGGADADIGEAVAGAVVGVAVATGGG